MTKLKIALVYDDSLDRPDGVTQYVLIVGQWLTGQGHDVHYLVGETKRTDIPQTHSLSRNVRVRFNRNRMAMPLPANKQALRKLLAREQFDIIHVQVPYSPFLAGRIIALTQASAAVVGTFHIAPHSWVVTLANRALRLWVARTLRRFDAMMAAPAAAAFAKRTFGIMSTQVPLPIQLDAFSGAKSLPQYAHQTTVLFLGRLVERKGGGYLLRAVAHLHAAGQWPHDARVVIAGTGPLEQALKTYVQNHKLTGIVTFVGFVSEADKPRYMASADIVALPSTGGESFGIVVVEALAAARGAVLAGDNPGYRGVLAPRPEALITPTDTPAFATSLLKLLKNSEERAAAHDWQQAYAKQFDVSAVGGRIVEIYHQALQARRK